MSGSKARSGTGRPFTCFCPGRITGRQDDEAVSQLRRLRRIAYFAARGYRLKASAPLRQGLKLLLLDRSKHPVAGRFAAGIEVAGVFSNRALPSFTGRARCRSSKGRSRPLDRCSFHQAQGLRPPSRVGVRCDLAPAWPLPCAKALLGLEAPDFRSGLLLLRSAGEGSVHLPRGCQRVCCDLQSAGERARATIQIA